MMNEAERGSLLPLLAVILVLAATVMLAIGRLGEAAVARARARSAADAAALAGAADDRAAATAMAGANGAHLLGDQPPRPPRRGDRASGRGCPAGRGPG